MKGNPESQEPNPKQIPSHNDQMIKKRGRCTNLLFIVILVIDYCLPALEGGFLYLGSWNLLGAKLVQKNDPSGLSQGVIGEIWKRLL